LENVSDPLTFIQAVVPTGINSGSCKYWNISRCYRRRITHPFLLAYWIRWSCFWYTDLFVL